MVSAPRVAQPRDSPMAMQAAPNPVPSDTPSTSLSWSDADAAPSFPGSARPSTVTDRLAYASPIPNPATDQTATAATIGSGPSAPNINEVPTATSTKPVVTRRRGP